MPLDMRETVERQLRCGYYFDERYKGRLFRVWHRGSRHRRNSRGGFGSSVVSSVRDLTEGQLRNAIIRHVVHQEWAETNEPWLLDFISTTGSLLWALRQAMDWLAKGCLTVYLTVIGSYQDHEKVHSFEVEQILGNSRCWQGMARTNEHLAFYFARAADQVLFANSIPAECCLAQFTLTNKNLPFTLPPFFYAETPSAHASWIYQLCFDPTDKIADARSELSRRLMRSEDTDSDLEVDDSVSDDSNSEDHMEQKADETFNSEISLLAGLVDLFDAVSLVSDAS